METNETINNVDAEIIDDVVTDSTNDNRWLIIGGVAVGVTALVAIVYKFGKPHIEKAIEKHNEKKLEKKYIAANVEEASDEK